MTLFMCLSCCEVMNKLVRLITPVHQFAVKKMIFYKGKKKRGDNIIIKLRLTLTCQSTSIYSSSVWGDKLGQHTNILYVQSELDKYTAMPETNG